MLFTIFITKYQRNDSNRAKLKTILLPLQLIMFEVKAEQLDLTEADAIAVRKRARAMVQGIIFAIGNFTIFLSAYFVYLYVSYVNLDRYWRNTLVFWIYDTCWIFCGMGTLCTSLAYFSIVCHCMKLRFINFNQRLSKLEQNRHEVAKILDLHGKHYRAMSESNRFWSIYLFFVHIQFLALLNTMAYLAFIAKIRDWYMRPLFVVIFCEFVVLFTIACISAGNVNSEVMSLYEGLTVINFRCIFDPVGT